MREKTCCFTGHRHIPPKEVDGIRERLEATIKMLYKGAWSTMGPGARWALIPLHPKRSCACGTTVSQTCA